MDAAITSASPAVPSTDRLEQAGVVAVIGFAAALQFSIAAAQTLLAIAIGLWFALVAIRHERISAPRFFLPLAVYAALTLVSAAFSPQPLDGLIDSKQLVLFLIVPLVYRFASGQRGQTLVTVIVTVGAASAALGIVEYAMLGYDNLGNRPRGTLGHYMTYSGLLMLVISAALARILFGKRDRLWAVLVMPALTVAVAFSFGRSAAVGACVAATLLLALKDFRLVVILPILGAILLAAFPGAVSQRFESIFDRNDATRRDRIAMIKAGAGMVADHPLVGVGPNRVPLVYPAYRSADAVKETNPHLHNVPVQIAAERGLPALAVWIWFLVIASSDLITSFKAGSLRVLAAAGMGAMAAMLAAGMFEYNFGDSEFLMLFLTLITLPFAAARDTADHDIA
ncbi:MAG TPA: O-antigen ligase family protein [Vicinamibacterales bacterium]|jgi:O-antigen ligase|nr:O-antigen ligase family protein [Vicinamibacterales bacterium]